MKPLVVIPARGGSKGILRKNIKPLAGRPLIQYTIEAARKLFADEIICVSTDDQSIKETVESLGLTVPFLRPSELATDESGSFGVLLNALDHYEANNYSPDVIILLQPTSPFRNAQHIEEALMLFNYQYDMIVSVQETKSNPYSVLFEDNEEGLLEKSKNGNFSRRQDCPKVWELNGAIYIINVHSLRNSDSLEFKRIKKYIMEEVYSLDIDTPFDWIIAESLIEKNYIKTSISIR